MASNIALTVVDLLLSTAAFDYVAVLSDFTPVIQDARPIKATVRQPSRILDHPIETGQIISDYSIILPIEIDLVVIVQAASYRSTYEEVVALYQAKNLLTVQTKTSSYDNMVIADIPHEETTDQYDAFSMVIKFRQVLVVQDAPPFMPADATQANTQSLGQQNATTATPIQQTSPTTTPSPASAIIAPDGYNYSSVQNLTSTNYTISGVQMGNGAQSITNASPAAIPVTGAATTTSTQSVSSVFNGGGF
jgi:Dit-like tail protein